MSVGLSAGGNYEGWELFYIFFHAAENNQQIGTALDTKRNIEL